MQKEAVTKKLPPEERTKVVCMNNNLVRIPKRFMDHLRWDTTGKIQINIQKGSLVLRQVIYCDICRALLTDEEKNNEHYKNKFPNFHICHECIANLQEEHSSEKESSN